MLVGLKFLIVGIEVHTLLIDVTVRISHFYWTYFRYACYCGQLACALLVWT